MNECKNELKINATPLAKKFLIEQSMCQGRERDECLVPNESGNETSLLYVLPAVQCLFRSMEEALTHCQTKRYSQQGEIEKKYLAIFLLLPILHPGVTMLHLSP